MYAGILVDLQQFHVQNRSPDGFEALLPERCGADVAP